MYKNKEITNNKNKYIEINIFEVNNLCILHNFYANFLSFLFPFDNYITLFIRLQVYYEIIFMLFLSKI